MSAEQPLEVRERPSLLNSRPPQLARPVTSEAQCSLLRHRYSSVTSVSSHLLPVFCLLLILIIDLRCGGGFKCQSIIIRLDEHSYRQTGDVIIPDSEMLCWIVERYGQISIVNVSIWF